MDKAKIKKCIKSKGIPKHMRNNIEDLDIHELFGSVKLRNNLSVAEKRQLVWLKQHILNNGVPDFLKDDDLAIGTIFGKIHSPKSKRKPVKKLRKSSPRKDVVLIKDLQCSKTFTLHQAYEPGKVSKYKLKYLRRDSPLEFIFSMNGVEVPRHRKNGRWITPRDGLTVILTK